MGDLFGWIAIITTCILLGVYISWWLLLALLVTIGALYIVLPKYRHSIIVGVWGTIVMAGIIALFYMAWHLFYEILPT